MKQKQTRAASHRALFDNNLPFRGRAEQLKTRYTRKQKHRKQEQ